MPGIFALIGALIGGGVTAYTSTVAISAQQTMQKKQFDQDQARLLREKRQPYYDAYNKAVQAYASRVQIRYECESAGTEACQYSRADMQTARYNLQGAVNDIQVFGSPEMQNAIDKLGKTMPSPLVGLAGELKPGPVDLPGFSSAMQETLRVTCRDLSPNPDTCKA